MQEDREWIWVTGNHDPKVGERLGGSVVGDIEVEGIVLRHEPRPGHVTHIAGHLHGRKAVDVRLHAATTLLRRQRPPPRHARLRHIRRRAEHPRRAVRTVFGNDGMHVWMLGQEGLYPVATRLLKED